MIIEIPYVYRAHYVERRARTPYPAYLTAVTAVRLAEVEPPKVKIAFVVADASGVETDLAAIGGRGRRIIAHRGGFMREVSTVDELRTALLHQWPLPPADEVDDGPATVRGAWMAAKANNPFHEHCRNPWQGPASRQEIERTSERGIRAWTDDNGAAVAEEIRRIAASMVTVRGVVFQPCPEPCWESDWKHTDNGEVTVRLGYARQPEDPDVLSRLSHDISAGAAGAGGRFALGRRDEAVAHAQAFAFGHKQRGLHVRVAASARVVLPGADMLPDDCLALEEAAALMLDAGRDHLSACPRPAAKAWHALRDACEASSLLEGRKPRPQASPRLAEAVAATEAAWRNYAVPQSMFGASDGVFGSAASCFQPVSSNFSQSHTVREALPDALDKCAAALARWERRPADGREWTHLGLSQPPSAEDGVRAMEILTMHDAKALSNQAGTDFMNEAVRAADGRCRLIAAIDGPRLSAVAVVEPSGLRVLYPSGGCSGAAMAAFASVVRADEAAMQGTPSQTILTAE